MSLSNVWLWIVIFIAAVLFFILMCRYQGDDVGGGMRFFPGQKVSTNDLLYDKEVKGHVLRSTPQNSLVRTEGNQCVVQGRQSNLCHFNNDILVGDIPCDSPSEVFEIHSVRNKGGSCSYDSVLYALIIPNLTYMYIQWGIDQTKKKPDLSPCDIKTLRLLEAYAESIRSSDPPSLKRSNHIEFMKYWEGSTYGKECDCDVREDPFAFTMSLIASLDINFLIHDQVAGLKLSGRLEDVNFDYDSNGKRQIILFRSERRKTLGQWNKFNFQDYELCSIVFGTMYSNRDHPRRPRYWRPEDITQEMQRKYKFDKHAMAICRCGDGWLYYNDNEDTLAGPFDSPLELFKYEGRGGHRIIPLSVQSESWGPLDRMVYMIFAAK